MSSEELDFAGSHSKANASRPLLPRTAWMNQGAFLRAVFKAKQALDQIEHESNHSNSISKF
jgi:hypothetical protein